MRNIYLLVGILWIGLSGCNNEYQKKGIGLQGNLKTISQKTYWATGDEDEKIEIGELFHTCKIHFNREGDLTGIKGKDMEICFVYRDEDGYNQMIWRGKDNIAEKRILSDFIKYEYSFPQDSLIATKKRKEKWEIHDYTTSPATLTWLIKEWNPEIRIIRLSTLDENKNILFLEQLRYNEQGLLISLTVENEEMLYRRTQQPYDDSPEKVYEWVEIYEHSERGQDTYVEANYDSSVYLYLKYDNKGNWCERFTRPDEKQKTYTKRKYTYY